MKYCDRIRLLSPKPVWNISDLQKTPEHLVEEELVSILDHRLLVGIQDASTGMIADHQNISSRNRVMVANGTGNIPEDVFLLHYKLRTSDCQSNTNLSSLNMSSQQIKNDFVFSFRAGKQVQKEIWILFSEIILGNYF